MKLKTLSEFGVEAGKINPDRIVFMEEKVKEFIRLLKEKMEGTSCEGTFVYEIDKLAGKELVK